MNAIEKDRVVINDHLASSPDKDSVAAFVPGPGICKLNMRVDLDALNADLEKILQETEYHGDLFKALPVNRRPGEDGVTQTDLSGRYYTRLDSRYEEVAVEDIVDEAAYTELNPLFAGTAFEEVFHALKERFTLGRMRVLSKAIYGLQFVASRP